MHYLEIDAVHPLSQLDLDVSGIPNTISVVYRYIKIIQVDSFRFRADDLKYYPCC